MKSDEMETKMHNLTPKNTTRPFFSYFGGKWRDAVKNYPEPRYSTIVEPFAGSAGYSTRYPDRNVILCDADPVIAGVWEYLIRVTPAEILSIPDVATHQTVDDLRIPQEARWLVGFWLNRATSTPRKSPSKWMRSGKTPGSFWGPAAKQRIASQVGLIRHWKIYNCTYEDCPVAHEASWLIDPPYEVMGRNYRFGSRGLDYEKLGAWCRERLGQVIVCENDGAAWLPFRHLAYSQTARSGSKSSEVVWMNDFTTQESFGVDLL